MIRKILAISAIIFCTITAFAQKDVTKFLGFPVDGSKSKMVTNLRTKGFRLRNIDGKSFMSGQFNGNNVLLYIMTEKGKVSRIVVSDENHLSETDIKIRFNKLCAQFINNGKYIALTDYTIPEREDISHEMIFNNKRYEAIFFQLPEGKALDKLHASILEKAQAKYTPEQLESPTEEIKHSIIQESSNMLFDAVKNKPVWFIISEMFGNYYITMFYDNEYNRANGEDL